MQQVHIAIAVAVLLLSSGCQSADSAITETTPAAPAQSGVANEAQNAIGDSEPTTAEVASEPPSTDATAEAKAITEADLQRFLAAAEFTIAGSTYEGVIYETPEIYIATAQTFCARLDHGDTLEDLIDDYLVQAGIESPTSEDLQFVGAILGAGVQTLCPEHTSKL